MAIFVGDGTRNKWANTKSDDSFFGKGGADTVHFALSTSGVVADLALTGAQDTNWGNDIFSSIEDLMGTSYADRFYGNGETNYFYGYKGDDRFWGRGGADELFGHEGDDRLYGGDGNDYLEGNEGDNYLHGGAGRDAITFFVSNMAVVVDLGKTTAQSTREGFVTLVSIEDARGTFYYGDRLLGNDLVNSISGSGGNDVIYGRGGNDFLRGDEGIDYLYGGIGRDTLSGGTGADRFVFSQLGDLGFGAAADRITDFEKGADRISLRLIDLQPGVEGHQGFVWSDEDFFSGKKGELIYMIESLSGPTYVLGDLDGDMNADMEIRLAGAHVMEASDFLL
jgi:Ca2+-binding RTX toxin-like protein